MCIRDSFEITRVGQQVEDHKIVVRMVLQHMKHKVAANESGSAGDEYFHKIIDSLKFICITCTPPFAFYSRAAQFA